MAFKPTLADIPEERTPPTTYTPTLSDISPAQPSYSAVHNIGAGVANPFISEANLLSTGISREEESMPHFVGLQPKTQEALQALTTALPAPSIPHSGIWEYGAGNVAALVAPFTGAERGAASVLEGAKTVAPAIERIPPLLQAMGRTGAASAGTAYAATPGPTSQRESAAVEGGVAGAALPVGGAILRLPKSMLKRVSKKVISHAVIPLHKYISESLSRINEVLPENTLGKAYQQAKANATWKKIDPLVESADSAQKFSPESYKTQAQQLLAQAQADEAADPDTYLGLSGQIQRKIERAPTSFADAITQKKAINQMPGSWDKMTNNSKVQRSRYYAGQLGQALDQTVGENATTPEAQQFQQEWLAQRVNHGRLQQFYANPQSAGTTSEFDPAIKQDLENRNFKAVIQRYVPTKNQEMSKVAKLRSLIGNDSNADHVLLNQALQPYRNSLGDVDALKLGKAIHQGKISTSLTQLMTPEEETGLGNIVQAQDVAQQLKKSPGILHQVSTHPISTALLASVTAHHFGLPPEMTIGAGIGGWVAPKNFETALAHSYEKRANKLLDEGRLDKLSELISSLKDTTPHQPWKDYVRRGWGSAAVSQITQPSPSSLSSSE